MAIKNLIGPGIGFNPGSVEFIVTRGLTSAAVVSGPTIVIEFDLEIEQVRTFNLEIEQVRTFNLGVGNE